MPCKVTEINLEEERDTIRTSYTSEGEKRFLIPRRWEYDQRGTNEMV